ncbi:Hint domain-containing protein [Tabrizicola sp.]|uniref:Hint domain-containing protein n=1 Tax=Tabrizicola sp. TaxID=2005166 RepID=UPI0035B3B92A
MATVVGDGGANSLPGSNSQNDSIWGAGGNDTLRGGTTAGNGGGNDLLDGGDGADVLYGGNDDDTLIGGSDGSNDTLFGGTGTDTADYSRYLTALSSVSGGSSTFAPNSTAVNVNLATGIATGLGTDSLSGIENVIGGSGADTITGDTLANRLEGGDGNDLIDGGSGDDTLYGGGANDTLYGGAGIDRLYGGADGDLAYGGADGDLIYGNDGLDTLFGDGGNDTLYGDAGNDVLDGGTEADALYGGTGSDTLYGQAGVDTLRGGDGDDLLYGGSENDDLAGEAGNDTLYGGAGVDALAGGDGNDLLLGEDGADVLDGGAGDDTLRGGAGGDSLNGGSGMDFVDYSDSNAGVSVNLSTNSFSGGYAAGDSGAGVDGIIGSAFNDTLVGFDGSSNSTVAGADNYTNIFYGGAGDDSISGLGGGDVLYGGADNDTVSGNDGDDLVRGDAGNDLLYGGAGNDTLYGDAGNDRVFGDAGNDLAYGGDNNDTVDGDAGNDTLYGDAGDDALYGGADNDRLYGGADNDTLVGGAGSDLVFGGDNRDFISATFTDSTGNETVDGGSGGVDNDTLSVDITGFGWSRYDINYDPTNHENGTMIFYGPGPGFPVVGTLTFTDIEHVAIVCFTAGTRILAERGPVAVETLVPGDLVVTRDNGLQPLRWVGSRQLSHAELLAQPQMRPVRIGPGALFGAGPASPLLVSPQHRVLVEGARAELYFGETEVLAPAKHLVGLPGVSRECPVEGVTYVHILFDRHEIVLSNGLWTESFQPAERTLNALDAAVRAEVLELFPELGGEAAAFPAARMSLKAHEARTLVAG